MYFFFLFLIFFNWLNPDFEPMRERFHLFLKRDFHPLLRRRESLELLLARHIQQASYSAPKHIFIYTTHIKHVRDRPNHEQMRLRRVCEQKNANEESRFAGTFSISAHFFFIFLIDYCGCVSSRWMWEGER